MSSTSSITDVAALARVSKATVSRVLSGRRTKDDNIAKRVRDAAEQLNYQANSAASALRSDTTNTIGLIMPGPTDPLAARLLAELEPEVNRSGRQLLLGLIQTLGRALLLQLHLQLLQLLPLFPCRDMAGIHLLLQQLLVLQQRLQFMLLPAPGTEPRLPLPGFTQAGQQRFTAAFGVLARGQE